MNSKLPGARISLLLAAVCLSVLPAGCSLPRAIPQAQAEVQVQANASGPLSVDAEGAIETMINPVRSAVLEGALFLAVLMVGGFCVFRSMTKKEIAVSAAIMSAIYLVIGIWQIWITPPFPLWLAIIQVQNWISHLAFVLIRLPKASILPCTFLSCFALFLFVLFGKDVDNTDNTNLTS